MTRKTKKLIYNIFATLMLVFVLVWVCQKFIHIGNIEFTENARVKQLIIPVHARVQGYIKEVRFDDYTPVKAGDTLLLIEQTEYRYLLTQAEASLQNALTDKAARTDIIATTQSNITVSNAEVEEARIRLENAERNFRRFEALYGQQAVTRQQFDDMQTNYEAAKARYEMLAGRQTSARTANREQQTRLGQQEAAIRLAEAAVELAQLNLSYTVITAPCDGTTGRREVQVGQYLRPGQTVVDVVDEGEKWIIANYKETQTAHIFGGEEVTIEVDAVPGHTFRGHVTALSQATGASFSLLEQDNSSGNFVKIEQRIPIRIDFDTENDCEALKRVRAGMNVTCKVHYRR